MNATETISRPDIDSFVAEVADRFTEEVKQGRAPSVEDYAQRHSEIATIIRQVFPALTFLGNLSLTAAADLSNMRPASSIEHPTSSIEDPAFSSPPLHGEGRGEGCGQLGDFRIVREIGRGGMGVVYEAEQISLGRCVALKVLPFAAMLDRQQLARFKNEARAAATLDHPNIVAVHSIGVERSVHFYAMQLIEGQSLAQVVEQLRQSHLPLPPGEGRGEGALEEGRGEGQVGAASRAALPDNTDLSDSNPARLAGPTSDTAPIARLTTLPDFDSREYFRAIAQLGIQAAEALDHAHQNGILHRDIKPANLLVDDTGKLWITDFGLARMEADAGMTMTGDILGTLRYMSPEQALAKRVVVDHRSDIYSLGVTLYELLTLQPAFTGDDRQELLRQIAFEEPRRLSHINARIPHDLETIIVKAIEKNPADRFATAKELAADLRRFAGDEPIKAKPPTWRDRAAKWSRRHPAAIWAAALILLSTTLIAAISALLITRAYQRETTQRQTAELSAKRAHAVTDFVVSAFRRPSPELDGRKVTMVDVLKRTVEDLEHKFTDDPNAKGDLYAVIGTTYLQLGMYAEAIPVLEKAREVRLADLGIGHVDTITSMRNLASGYQQIGRHQDALDLKEETLKLSNEHLGAENLTTLYAASDLASAYLNVGRVDDAVPLIEENVRFFRTRAGHDHRETINAIGQLSEIYAFAGRLVEALPLAEEHFRRSKSKLGPDHPRTLGSIKNLANIYARVGRLDEAIPLHKESVDRQKAVFGVEDPRTLGAMHDFATDLTDAGQPIEATPIFEEVIAVSTRRFGDKYPLTLSAKFNLARLFLKDENADKALPLLEAVYRDAKSSLGSQHSLTHNGIDLLVFAYYKVGRHEDVLTLLKEFLAETESESRPNDLRLSVMNDLAWLLATAPNDKLRDGKQAVELATNACELLEYKDPGVLDTLAAAYAETGDFVIAIKWSQRAIEMNTDDTLGKQLIEHLESYQAARPWREE